MRWAANLVLPDSLAAFAPDLKLHGTVWQGTASGLPVFGTANLDVAPLGRRLEFQAGRARNYLSGQLSPREAKDIDFRLDFASVPFTDGRLQGLNGDFIAEISDAQIEGQTCKSFCCC